MRVGIGRVKECNQLIGLEMTVDRNVAVGIVGVRDASSDGVALAGAGAVRVVDTQVLAVLGAHRGVELLEQLVLERRQLDLACIQGADHVLTTGLATDEHDRGAGAGGVRPHVEHGLDRLALQRVAELVNVADDKEPIGAMVQVGRAPTQQQQENVLHLRRRVAQQHLVRLGQATLLHVQREDQVEHLVLLAHDHERALHALLKDVATARADNLLRDDARHGLAVLKERRHELAKHVEALGRCQRARVAPVVALLERLGDVGHREVRAHEAQHGVDVVERVGAWAAGKERRQSRLLLLLLCARARGGRGSQRTRGVRRHVVVRIERAYETQNLRRREEVDVVVLVTQRAHDRAPLVERRTQARDALLQQPQLDRRRELLLVVLEGEVALVGEQRQRARDLEQHLELLDEELNQAVDLQLLVLLVRDLEQHQAVAEIEQLVEAHRLLHERRGDA